ncbi:MAG: sugar transporter [Pseudomonadota bacterium]
MSSSGPPEPEDGALHEDRLQDAPDTVTDTPAASKPARKAGGPRKLGKGPAAQGPKGKAADTQEAPPEARPDPAAASETPDKESAVHANAPTPPQTAPKEAAHSENQAKAPDGPAKGPGTGPGPQGKGPGGPGGPAKAPNTPNAPNMPGGPGGPQAGPGGPKPDGPPVTVQPVVPPARMRRRHWGILISFLFLVLIPTALAGTYLAFLAQDQYRSTTGFVVRQDEGNTAAVALGGLAQFVGGTASSDGNVLFEFVQSQSLVSAIDAKLDIRGHYAQHWPEDFGEGLLRADPVFSIWPDASIEDLNDYWQRMVRISFDEGTGLVEVQVLAFDPAMAQAIGQEILAQSRTMINALNETARTDAMRYANADLETALTRLKAAREALTQFRTRTQIVDPLADLQGRMGVITNLQQQLAEALIEFDLLQDTTRTSDPRVAQALRRIEVIQERILRERENFTGADTSSAVAEDYPVLLAEYESLLVDSEFAEETYRLALVAVEAARSNATRQSRYLATYIEPTLPETAEFPQRLVLGGLAGLFLTLLWGVAALVYYSIRDRQ